MTATTAEVPSRLNKKRELARFLKFCAVGVLGAIIDFGLLNLLVNLAGFPKEVANACSFSLAVTSNFIWNRLWVYPETRGEPLRKQFAQFGAVNVVGLLLNTGILIAADSWLLGESGLLAEQMASLADIVGKEHRFLALNGAKAIATGVVLFWNFAINRLWTFRHVE